MADSDSEAFESADEEVDDKKSKKVTHDNIKAMKREVVQPKASSVETKSVEPPKKEQEQPETKEEPPRKEEEPQQKIETPTTSSWRSWGAFTAISNASKTVASITTQVSQSISTAIDSMNIPEPEEMAKIHAEQKKASETDETTADDKNSEKSDDSRFKLDSILSGVSHISSKVVSGGLDTLEGIGKKTINILQETDPNIKNKLRSMKVNSQPNLSDLLKEAKDREDEPTSGVNDKSLQPVSFEHLLDDYKGLVFLEALEILSNQSKMKIELLMKPLNGKVLTDMEETLEEVKELCEFDVENFDESLTVENFESKLLSATDDLSVKLNFAEIVNCSVETQDWLDGDVASLDLNVLYDKSIQIMAKLCALSLNNLQKLAELLLSQDHRSTADEADSLTQLAAIYCSLFNLFAIKFTEKLTAISNAESKKYATNLFLESSHAITHIKNAFDLFLPVLQIGAV